MNHALAGIALFAFLAPAHASPPGDDVAGSLPWRLVGPHRAGWSTVVTGVPQDPETFYFGAAGGGVWKTTDAGRTWQPIFDRGPACVGALAIAPSDPNTVYAGTGQVTSRYDIAAGEGVFKSIDGGKTWFSIGLEATRHIGSILVDPRDPKIVLVAALGHVFGPNKERGVYRSDDGGATWTQTLFVSENTGAVDLVFDPASPEVVFASVWQMRHRPWLAYFEPTDGEESGLWRSSDGGRTWTRIAGGGWPEGKLGRIGLSVTRTGDKLRVYAAVEAERAGGLYRSDDGGVGWTRVNGERGLGSNYFAIVTAMPGDPDTVFVMGQSIRRCTAGGTKCEVFKGSPGGDDYHHLWIDTAHPERMISGSDQGTAVTVNGGATWSSWYNQPTGQFYHLATDNRFPYWIYSGQQDNGTAAIASRSDYGSITFRDWHPVGADERDYDIPDPVDPDIVYGSGLGGRLSRWNAKNGEVQNISPWPVSSYGARPTTVKYHYSWITPIAVSSASPYPLYQGAQVLFRSDDRGAHWKAISPDATLRGTEAAACRNDVSPAQARTCGFGVIASIGLAPRDNQTIWIGTDDGRVRVTRNAGKSWSDVTPPAVPPWAKVATIDVSALDAASVYIAVDNHRQDDFTPYAFRTHDGGKTWSPISRTLLPGHFVSALRADPARRGLLYAGTDRGVFVSLDDGDRWMPLGRDLPTVIVTDLLVHGDDLIVATQGRAIWILDDVAPLREAGVVMSGSAANLFTPAPAMRVRRNQGKDTPLPYDEPVGQNPPAGAIIDYWLGVDAAAPVKLEIKDGKGRLVRRFDSDAKPESLRAERYFDKRWVQPPQPLSATAGAHRFVWDLREERPRVSRYEYSIAAIDGAGTALLPEGMLVPPGDYDVTLTAGGRTYTRPLRVVADPRVPVDRTALASASELSRQVVEALARHATAAAQIRAAREKLDAGPTGSHERDLAALDAKLAPMTARDSDESPNLDAIGGALTALQIDLEDSDRAPTEPQRRTFEALSARLATALKLLKDAAILPSTGP